MLVNFGDFVEGGSSKSDPYIQLLSTTNDTAATHKDFVDVRLGGKDTTTDKSTGNGSSPLSSKAKKFAIIGGAIALGALLLVGALCFCCLRKRGTRSTARQGGVMGFGGQAYRPLNEPAPGAATETHAMPNLSYNNGGYNQGPPPYAGQQPFQPQNSQYEYQTAWDHRV